ncbi:MAG: hypothetical protein F4Y08_04855 [Caldilineaceae bacterium SB0662_bin_9]|uniref:Uncharacterized protein n=1 Tax=Caldilineaceae bacterium SB0662_bin_9 TaxID=2605258 RepID=A0A6B1DPK9_9CHLR|nr:hypothetical protein [Caldilineaceae bacterium]MXZ41911.1 hypothetical protein [Caldilineaceae bacterium SB0666_bin_21]MYD89659.1 hypothetical protein [Caldilineaceae bacterium SB0662_bin_9]
MKKIKCGAVTFAKSVPLGPYAHAESNRCDMTVSQSAVAELQAPISPPEFLIGLDRATGRSGHRNVN